jgi:protocatechuate 3,4-dioxygenase beta subunit
MFPDTQPSHLHAPYMSSVSRAPMQPLVKIPQTLSEVTGPQFGREWIAAGACDLSLAANGGEAIGQRIVVSGRVLDENARPVRNTLVEIWQANAAGRYAHSWDQHNAPLDPNFSGQGYTMTDSDGRYRFITIRPGSYPWGNHYNAWRPAHIHFSLFGPAVATRLVTQMYFPGDCMLDVDPIYNCVPDEKARARLISTFDWETTQPGELLGYRFDVILRGRDSTPMEDRRGKGYI